MHPHHAPPHATPHPRRWRALVLLCLAQAMLVVDITVVNVALPSIGADLDLGRESLTWIVTGYTLTFGGLMLLGGRLADVFGRRRVLLAGLALFTLASLAAGLAGDGAVLLAGRLAQGVGAALLSPAAMSTVTTMFHGRERHRALGVWAAIGGGGAALGVLIGGLLTAGPGWEWAFIVNVPIGLLVLALLPRLLPIESTSDRLGRIDLPGAVTVTLATASLVYGLVRAGDDGWGSITALAPIGAAAVLYAVFAAVERRWPQPLVRLPLLTRRTTLAGVFLMLVATGLLISFFFLGSLYLQGVREMTPLRTGLLFLPAAVTVTLGAHLAGNLVGRIGPRAVAVAGLFIAGAGAGWLVWALDRSVAVGFLPGFAVAAAGLGALFVTATTTAMSAVDHREAGVTSGIVTTFHELGGSIGVAVMSTVAAAGIEGGSATGFTSAFAVCAVTAGLAALICLRLVPSGRIDTSGMTMAH
ncbi:MFS transporter [Phytomonospora sp. NPDC050363]|uniref:MFS transporter n=1 Tax=Phytomonospora sp. NPDC050363 TaxID=3155642 RepID=UPI0033CD401E